MNMQSTLNSTIIATMLFACVITTAVIGGDETGKLGPVDSITLADQEFRWTYCMGRRKNKHRVVHRIYGNWKGAIPAFTGRPFLGC